MTATTKARARRWIAIGLGLVGLLLGMAMCKGVAERGRFTTEYSTFGAGPDGAKAIHLVLEGMGARVTRWVRDLDHLPPRGALVVLGGCGSSLAHAVSRNERRELDGWVRDGGTLIVAGASGFLPAVDASDDDDEPRREPGAFEDVGVSIVTPAGRCRERTKDEQADRREAGARMREDPVEGLGKVRSIFEEVPVVVVRALPSDPAISGIGWVTFTDPLALKIDVDERTALRTLLTSEAGEPLAVAVQRGRGHVVVLASGDALRNAAIERSGGDVLLVRLLRTFAPRTLPSTSVASAAEAVLFDEYHLGLGEKRGLMTWLNQLGLGSVALQAVITLGLLVLAFAVRFGAPRLVEPERPHDARTYVGALGRIYERTADVQGTVVILVREALSRIARAQRVGASDPEQIAARLDGRKQTDAATAVRALAKMVDEDARGRGGLAKAVTAIDALVARATRKA